VSEPIGLAFSSKSPIPPARSPTERQSDRKSPVASSIEHAPAVIKSFEDIERLVASRTLAKRLPRGGLPIDIPGLSDQMSRLLALEVRRFARACGCASGSAGFFVTAGATIVIAYHLILTQHWRGLFCLIASATIVLPITTAVCKILGREVARIRFRRNCNRLIAGYACINGSGAIRGGTT
jgi:hypothetical protein